MGTLSRGNFSTHQTIPAFNRLGGCCICSTNEIHRGKLGVDISKNCLHYMYNACTDLNKFKVTWRGLNWDGKFKVTTQVQGHCQGQPMVKVTLKVTPENHSRGHSRSFQDQT